MWIFKGQMVQMKSFFLFMFLLLSTLLLISQNFIFSTELPIYIIFIHKTQPGVFQTSSKFLSITLDAAVIAENFKNFDMSSEKLIKMIKYLSPGYLRIGGSLGDTLKFSLINKTEEYANMYTINSTEEIVDSNKFLSSTLTAKDWLRLNNFSKHANMDIFFGLNALERFTNGSWDYRNAELMIKFSANNGLIVNWELGNEPNLFKHKFNREVNASQMAKDFHTLRTILNKYKHNTTSLLVGPDVTRSNQSVIYLRDFIENAKTVLNKITWHQYYFDGRTAQSKDFLDHKIYDILKVQINTVNAINTSNKSIWLGETSSAYGGGAPNLSDRFIGSFIWLDKLGLSAKMGVEVVMRQSIFHENYALLDTNYNPNPDWWVSLLYKKLVGRTVVPNNQDITNDKVRLYVHCLQGDYHKSIVVFGINIDKSSAKIRIEGFDSIKITILYAHSYELQSPDLFSKNVYLNGKLLSMLPNSDLPIITPKKIKISPHIVMLPFSIVFWVINDVNVEACSKSNYSHLF